MSEAVIAKAAIKKGKKAIEKKNEVLTTLKIAYVPVSAVTPNDYNPNRQSEHDFALLCKSIEEDGFTQPVVGVADPSDPVVLEPDGAAMKYISGKVIIVDGEHRWRAASELGMTEIPVVVTPMTVAQARISTLRHNRARGSEDIELTAALLADLRELGALDWAQDSLQMDDLELQRLLDDVPAPEALAAKEFTASWDPTRGTSGSPDTVSEMHQVDEHQAVSMTPAAIQEVRRAEVRMQDAKTEEDKTAARRDVDTYRLVAVFAGDEAGVVRKILGNSPAAKILELCQAAE